MRKTNRYLHFLFFSFLFSCILCFDALCCTALFCGCVVSCCVALRCHVIIAVFLVTVFGFGAVLCCMSRDLCEQGVEPIRNRGPRLPRVRGGFLLLQVQQKGLEGRHTRGRRWRWPSRRTKERRNPELATGANVREDTARRGLVIAVVDCC